MSGTGQASIGQILRDAREAQGMGVEAVAARLRLMQRQVETIEADNFEGLGRPVFARGFVRNYARLMGLDPAPLLDRMEGPQTEPMPVRRPEPPLPRARLSSPWLMAFLLVGLGVVAVPIGLYWWLNQGEEALLHKVPLAVQVEPVDLGATAPDPGAPAPDGVQPAAELLASASADETLASADETLAPSAQESTAAPTTSADAAASGVLQFEFAGDAWIEIRDAGGRTLHRQLNPAGSSIEVRGRPPFRLLVGNAAQVRMTYNGRPIDLKPFIDVAVARFTLEE